MTIEIRKPGLEQLVQDEILRGHFDSVDDLLMEPLQALREKNTPAVRQPQRKKPGSIPDGISFCRV